jgi:hypothetical protein
MAVSGESNTCAYWITKPNKAKKILCIAEVHNQAKALVSHGEYEPCESTVDGEFLRLRYKKDIPVIK